MQELGSGDAKPKMVFLLENACSPITTASTSSPPRSGADSALERLPKPGLIGESMYRRRYSEENPLNIYNETCYRSLRPSASLSSSS